MERVSLKKIVGIYQLKGKHISQVWEVKKESCFSAPISCNVKIHCTTELWKAQVFNKRTYIKEFLKIQFHPLSIFILTFEFFFHIQWPSLLGPGWMVCKNYWGCLGIYSGGSRREQLAAWYNTSSRAVGPWDPLVDELYPVPRMEPLWKGLFCQLRSCLFLQHCLTCWNTTGNCCLGVILQTCECCRVMAAMPQD